MISLKKGFGDSMSTVENFRLSVFVKKQKEFRASQ